MVERSTGCLVVLSQISLARVTKVGVGDGFELGILIAAPQSIKSQLNRPLILHSSAAELLKFRATSLSP
jgi:hypothetical protein